MKNDSATRGNKGGVQTNRPTGSGWKMDGEQMTAVCHIGTDLQLSTSSAYLGL